MSPVSIPGSEYLAALRGTSLRSPHEELSAALTRETNRAIAAGDIVDGVVLLRAVRDEIEARLAEFERIMGGMP